MPPKRKAVRGGAARQQQQEEPPAAQPELENAELEMSSDSEASEPGSDSELEAAAAGLSGGSDSEEEGASGQPRSLGVDREIENAVLGYMASLDKQQRQRRQPRRRGGGSSGSEQDEEQGTDADDEEDGESPVVTDSEDEPPAGSDDESGDSEEEDGDEGAARLRQHAAAAAAAAGEEGSDPASDSSEDERPNRNTIGAVPLEWYQHEEHIGYDKEGRRLEKKPGGKNSDQPYTMQASMTQKACVAGQSVKAAAPAARRQGRFVAVRVSALGQKAEYIWYDGQEGQPQKGAVFNEMRSKTKVLQKPVTSMDPKDFPEWSFDGSSTGQAEGRKSDCILRPVCVVPDPIRGGDNVLVMCDVLDEQHVPHETNTRAKLAAIINDAVEAEAPLFGFEQEYTMLSKGGHIFGWPSGGYPAPQGPFYCGVGHESVYGRPLAEAHLDACVKAGLIISGINAEVMPGQWEFQIGPTGPLETGDQVMIARWLLHRLGEEFGIVATFAPKPVKGDWNGTGAHTNYSTKSMREDGGMKAIEAAIERLSKCHPEHISQYGTGNEDRLTGAHETCDINTFKFGVADRGSSIRIPLPVQLAGKGYLEDRRPAANVDPYTVVRLLIKNTLL